MTVITMLEFPDVTQELYERVGWRLALSGAPKGIRYHACGAIADGWRIVDIWDSQEAFDQFVDAIYLPAMLAEGGPPPSRREVIIACYAGPVQ